jgi:hypothetical protein
MTWFWFLVEECVRRGAARPPRAALLADYFVSIERSATVEFLL